MSADLGTTARAASLFELLRAWEHPHTGGARVGGSGPAAAESVRLRGHHGLGFPARDVHGVELLPGGRLRVDVTFLTLLGHDAPLPDHDVLAVQRAGDARARDFLDVFGHRLLSLLYAAWARTRPDVGEPARRLFAALVDPTRRGPGAWTRPDLRKGPRSAASLERLVSAQLHGAPVRVEPCVPRRIDVPADQRTVLGVRSSTLGVDAVLGARVWSASGSFRLHVGPVEGEVSEGLTPGGALHRAVSSLVSDWLGTTYAWSLRVIRRPELASVAVLGGAGPGASLGVDTWLGRPRAARVVTELPPWAGEEDP